MKTPDEADVYLEPKCDKDGNFLPKQCVGRTCVCVKPGTGERIDNAIGSAETLGCTKGMACWKFFPLFCRLLIFFKINFLKNSFRNTITVSNRSDPVLSCYALTLCMLGNFSHFFVVC